MEIIIAIICLVLGVAIGYILGIIKYNRYKTQIAVMEAQLANIRESYNQSLSDKEKNFADIMAKQEQNSKKALDALQGRFDETVAKMKAELEIVTAEMLKRREDEFVSTNFDNMARILEPLNLNLRQMREAVDQNTTHHAKLGGELASNLRLVIQHSDEARRSADRLSEALRSGAKVQGDWGETILTELLESQGLKEGIHFDTQVTLTDNKGNNVLSNETGARLRPDVVLHLDREREVIIDAKVSLSAFIDYVNAETEEKRSISLRKHIESIEKHIKELSKKDYTSYVVSPKICMNYVIMFVPNSAALYLATSEKSDLWRKAMEKGVYIADEQTLYAALKIIDMTWRQIAQAENHEQVYKLADEMLDRVARFIENFSTIGQKLEDAQKAYNNALAKLGESGQSIPNTCHKLIKMGAKSKKASKGRLASSNMFTLEE